MDKILEKYSSDIINEYFWAIERMVFHSPKLATLVSILTKKPAKSESPADVGDLVNSGYVAVFSNYKYNEEFFVYEKEKGLFNTIKISNTQKGYSITMVSLSQVDIVSLWAYSDLVGI